MVAAKRRRCAALPDHLIEEIFLRLPPKSVFRCRCLSRAWAATLSSDDFVDCYLCVANRHGGPRIVGVEDMLDGDVPKVLPPLTTTPRVIPIDSFPRIATALPYMEGYEDEPPIHSIAAMPVTPQCRSLVLLRAIPRVEAFPPDMYFVCNPSTGQMMALPEGQTTGRRRGYRENYQSLGLSYDIRTRKHKVVCIYYNGRHMSSSSGCEVLEIDGPTGMWRPTGEKPTGWIESLSAFAQGHVYWLAYREFHPRRQDKFIMSISLGYEKLGAIQLPPLDMDSTTPNDLTELGGRLCLFASDKYRYHIWLLDQYGLGGSTPTWDLRYRVDVAPEVTPFGGGASPLAIIDDGRRILLTEPDCPGQVYAYDPLTKETENLLEWTIPNSALGISCAVVYQESIASPGRQPRKDTILSSSPSTQALWLLLKLQCLLPCTIGRLMCVCRSWRSMICYLR